ncbi:MAG: DMT family transporter [Betaproteobacteria bacterium]|nr:DMT family transporter [Betaproteobacteria bacterium]
MSQRTLNGRSALLLTVPPLMWAANAVVGRLAIGLVPPVTLNTLRWVGALLILLPLGWRALRDPQALRRRWRHLAALGLLGMGSYNALQYLALHTSSPLNVTLIAASSPVWMLGIGALFYGVHPTRRDLVGAVLSLAGVMLVISRGSSEVLAQVRFVQGDLLMVVAIISWCLYSWLLARPPQHMRGPERPPWDWAEFLLVQTVFGLVWCSASSAVEAGVTRLYIEPSLRTLAVLVFVALGPAVIAYRCWGLGVMSVGPGIAGFFVNLTPLFTAVMSAAVLEELPRWYHGAAFVLIVAGIWVSGRGRQGGGVERAGAGGRPVASPEHAGAADVVKWRHRRRRGNSHG